MLKKSDIPNLPGKTVIITHTNKTYEIISASVVRWAGLVAVLRDAEGEERKIAIHTSVWDPQRNAYIL